MAAHKSDLRMIVNAFRNVESIDSQEAAAFCMVFFFVDFGYRFRLPFVIVSPLLRKNCIN